LAKVDVSISLEHEGLLWLGEWTQYPPYTGSDGLVAPHCYLVISQLVDGRAIPVSDLEQSLYRKVPTATLLIARERAMDVRNELFPTGDENVHEVLDTILEKVSNAEWMAQTTHNQEFTIYELALLLGVTERTAMERAKSLQKDGKVTLLDGGTMMPSKKEQ